MVLSFDHDAFRDAPPSSPGTPYLSLGSWFSDWRCAICDAVNCVVFRTTPTKKKFEKGTRKSPGWILGVLASIVALTPGNLRLFRREGVVVKELAKVMMMIPYGSLPSSDL
jgi:hypothetical protein